MHPKVAVVILNYNGKHFLEKFLSNILEHSSLVAKVIVADNASTDDSIAFLTQHFPEIQIIINEENGGFAKGYNDALRHVEADYYILLNSDVEVTPGWIEPVIGLMESNKDIVIAQPKILDFNSKKHFEYAGAAGGFIDFLGYPFCRGRVFNTLEADNGQYDSNAEIFWATGACMFIKSKIFHELGGFDSTFFAHMEEIDLCWRARNRGLKVACCAKSTVYHVGGGTLNKISPRKTFLNFRNNLMMFVKNTTGRFLYLKIFIRILLDLVAAAKFFLEGEARHSLSVFKAHKAFFNSWPALLRERKQLEKERIISFHALIYPRSIVVSYYLKGLKKFKDLKW